jgi:hypothetical protein
VCVEPVGLKIAIFTFNLFSNEPQNSTLLVLCAVVLFGTIATGVAFLASIVPGPISQVYQSRIL